MSARAESNSERPQVTASEARVALSRCKRLFRKLQKPYGDAFWDIERAIADIDTELERFK
jgi:hypothetical protein